MLRPLRISCAALVLAASGCYSGLDLDEGWTAVTAASAPSTGDSGTNSSGDDPTSGGGGGTDGGSMSGAATSAGSSDGSSDATSAGATTEPTDTTGDEPGTTSGPSQTTDPDPTNGTTTNGTTTTDGGTTTNGSTTTDPSTTSTTGDPNPNPDVPDGVPYCEPAKNWDAAWTQKEEDILVAVNQVRAQGANCGSEGNFGPAGPLTMNPALRCAARMHSKDMNDRSFFDHTNPDGELPWDRMDKASYGNYSNAGENIAAGSPDAAGTMDQWMNSDGHCANIMNPAFKEIGVGYYPGGEWGHLWTQVFGAK